MFSSPYLAKQIKSGSGMFTARAHLLLQKHLAADG